MSTLLSRPSDTIIYDFLSGSYNCRAKRRQQGSRSDPAACSVIDRAPPSETY